MPVALDEVRPRRHDMNVFMRCMETKMRAIGLYDPPPPPVAQRGNVETRPVTNGHNEPPGKGKGVWSMVLANPREG